MQLFKFFHTENTSTKQQKMVAGFCEDVLSENDFEAVLINFCCYEYIIVPMLQGRCWSYANSLIKQLTS